MFYEEGFYEEEKKSNDRIMAEALGMILRNQIKLKLHLGIEKDDIYYGSCYYDREMIKELESIE